jgi:hypothetical protein
MIQFHCDKCDMLIELDDDQAGTKHECLNCGDINRVPNPQNIDIEPPEPNDPVDSKRTDRAAKAGYPADFGPEARVMKVRRCWFRSRAIRFSITTLIVVASLIGLLWTKLGDHGMMYYLLFGFLTIGGLALIGWWWIDRFTAAFEITTKRTIMHRGFFSKSSSEVVHDNIRNIQVDQSFLQRLTNVGRIGISSSGQDGVEIQVNHLPNPDKLREIIDLYRPI